MIIIVMSAYKPSIQYPDVVCLPSYLNFTLLTLDPTYQPFYTQSVHFLCIFIIIPQHIIASYSSAFLFDFFCCIIFNSKMNLRAFLKITSIRNLLKELIYGTLLIIIPLNFLNISFHILNISLILLTNFV